MTLKHPTRTKNFQQGFTLIELLAVVAILVILIVLTFPMFKKLTESSRNVECLSNLKKAGIGLIAYANEHDQTLPRVSIAATESNPVSNWVYLVTGFQNSEHDYMDAKVGPNLITLSRKATGKKSPLLCAQNSLNAGSPRNSTATTYAMNNNCSSLRLLAAQHPSKTCLLVEGVPVSGGWPISIGPGSSLLSTKVHGQHANVLFLDGHVGAIRKAPENSSEFWVPN